MFWTNPPEVVARCEKCEESDKYISVKYVEELDDWYCDYCRDIVLSDKLEEEAT